MKNILSKIGLALIVIFGLVAMLYSAGVGLYKFFDVCIKFIKNVGNGSWVVGIILLPLSVYGAIQIIRGFCSLCDEGKINSTWNVILTIASILALFFAVYRF